MRSVTTPEPHNDRNDRRAGSSQCEYGGSSYRQCESWCKLGERGVTFLFSTHDARVMRRAKRLVRLVDGRVESDETQAS